MDILLLILAVQLLRSNSCYAYYNLAGPYEITVEDSYECEDVGTHQIQYKFKIKKVNATTRLLQSNVTYEINEEVSMKISAAKWTSGGWGKNAYNSELEDYCAAWRDHLGEIFEAWCNALETPIQCPLPLGSFSMPVGMRVTYRNLKMFPSLPYGRYKGEVTFNTGDTRVGCVVLVVNIDEVASTSVIG